MRQRLFFVVALLGFACGDVGQLTSSTEDDLSAGFDPTTDIKVSTRNLRGVLNDDTATGEEQVWKVRRPLIFQEILASSPDVMGINEADVMPNYGSHLVDGSNQMLDFINGLKNAGGTYELTNPASFDCVNPDTSARCVFQDRQASGSTRIIYNPNRVALLDEGTVQYTSGTKATYMVWGRFQHLVSGKQFFFAGTHLSTGSTDIQKAEVMELISQVQALHGSLPVIVVGDFQKSRWHIPTDSTLPAMKNAGFGDVLNQTYQQSTPSPRAKKLTNSWMGSFNGFDRNVADFSAVHHDNLGPNIDYIFATNSLTVKLWKVVVNYDPQTMKLVGVIPSDHNLVRAIIKL